jgi:hypothetical protein
MTKPIRIQLSRKKGWRMPPNTISVARPTMFGNPWCIGLIACNCRTPGECRCNSFRCATAAEAVEAFREWWAERLTRLYPYAQRAQYQLDLLKGRNLACWCKIGEPCHADVLLELANREDHP